MHGIALITGGSGYLGSHLAKELIQRQAYKRVRVFDWQHRKYVPDDAEFIQGDIRDAAAVNRAVDGVDTVFHLAFTQSYSRLSKKEKWDVDIGGSTNVFEACLKANVRKLVHTSTIEIYGTKPPFPCPEDAPTDKPVGIYASHKLEVEKILWKYHEERGLKATAVRMPTICGPGYYNHRPLLTMMDRILDNKAVSVVGDGSILGDFVYYKDVLDGFIKCAERDEAIGQAFNISCKAPSSHLEVMEATIAAVNSRSKIVKLPRAFIKFAIYPGILFGLINLPFDEVGYLFNPNAFSVEKARKLLGYNPTKTAAEAAVELIKGYQADRDYIKQRSQNF